MPRTRSRKSKSPTPVTPRPVTAPVTAPPNTARKCIRCGLTKTDVQRWTIAVGTLIISPYWCANCAAAVSGAIKDASVLPEGSTPGGEPLGERPLGTDRPVT